MTSPETGRRLRRPDFWTLAGLPGLLFVLLAFGVPMVTIVVRSLTDPSPENFQFLFTDELFRRSLLRTVYVALLVTGLSVLLGYPYAYAMARSGPVLRTWLMGALLLSFWTSLLVRTFAWGVLLSNTGVVNDLLLDLGVIDQPLPLIRNLFAVLVGMVHVLVPFAILAIYASLRGVDAELEQAAQVMGARPARAFWHVTLPLSMPGVAAGAVLVFVLSLGFYLTPALLGGPADILVSQSIVLQVQQYLDPGVGSAMAVVLLALVLAFLAIASKVVGLGRILGVTGKEGTS
ncbi:ABC transporter permease [Jiangella muralis]|uniref:ABC transporter permease n=1 Tax=Jiangella muralis TaxID=702383 RepID=UPI00069D11D6|nr:ABC transporter permease [Jiangella muralis]